MGRQRLYPDKASGYQALQQGRKAGRQIRRTRFISIDGEGVDIFVCGREIEREHRYVLLGVGTEQISDPRGLRFETILEFIWKQYERQPDAAYTGFFLGYDFGQWFRSIPADIAGELLTKPGRDGRSRRSRGHNHQPFPVTFSGWAFDMLGNKRFRFKRYGTNIGWCYICDTGPFFQTSLLTVINPENWQQPVVTEQEYATLVEGKNKRATARLDDNMRRYNVLENVVHSRVMERLETGFLEAGVRLRRDQWYGPGQAASGWLDHVDGVPVFRAPRKNVHFARKVLDVYVPAFIQEQGRMSYYGGWFEIFAHGIVPGHSWEYDINSAYPYVISRLPCLFHGEWSNGTGDPRHDTPRGYTIVRARIGGNNRYAGSALHRRADGRILRPKQTKGTYWLSEIDAAIRAGLIDSIEIEEWYCYEPCDCPPPLRGVAGLYDQRLRIGKNTSSGKACKLVYNSMYGKFAQSVGIPKYANSIYASKITSGCREMILDAIATHPEGASALLMVATDGVYFRTSHPLLPRGTALGEWEEATHDNLTLFKPGVYWDDIARSRLARGESPSFKARGISYRDFAGQIQGIDGIFRNWNQDSHNFPEVKYHSSFSMISPLQALQRNDWGLAGKILHDVELTQSADPSAKREGLYYDQVAGYWRSSPHQTAPEEESVPYDKRFGQGDTEDPEDFGLTPDGYVLNQWKAMLRKDI